jgi:hypothetical protein
MPHTLALPDKGSYLPCFPEDAYLGSRRFEATNIHLNENW